MNHLLSLPWVFPWFLSYPKSELHFGAATREGHNRFESREVSLLGNHERLWSYANSLNDSFGKSNK